MEMDDGWTVEDLDKLIEDLTNPKNQMGKLIDLRDTDIYALCKRAKKIFSEQPVVLELNAPIKIVGDIHGQFSDLLRLFSFGGLPPAANYLFLDDSVDRGKQSLETICLRFAYKIKYPENFFLLRGNHEASQISRIYGFYDDCKKRFNTKMWKTFCGVFDMMPLAALVEDKIFCMHGGISPQLNSLDELNAISRPCEVPDDGLICDLLWSDPEPGQKGWGASDRGVSFTFGEDVLTRFMAKLDFDLICRAHQVVEEGYEFFAKRQLVVRPSLPSAAPSALAQQS